MPFVRLKGLNKVGRRLADGRRVTYWYAWKGGPRLPGKPGDPAFLAAYNAAIADRKAPAAATLGDLVALYRGKPEFLRLADTTRAEWDRWLNRIVAHEIGRLPYRALDDRRVRQDLLEWRDEYADRPRTADYGVQVLSRVLSFGVERGILTHNHAKAIPQLYEANRADKIWSDDDRSRFCGSASAPVARALRLACLTGLRRGDLVKLQWRQVGDLVIEKTTSKSGGASVAVIPLLEETRALLAEIGRREPEQTVLVNARGRPWTPDGLTHQIIDVTTTLGIDRTLHDARGTFATRLRLAGLERDEIADIMGWKRDRVDRILTRYVDHERTIRHMAERLRANESGTKTPN